MVRVIPLIANHNEVKETKDPSDKAEQSLLFDLFNLPPPRIPLISTASNVGNHINLGGTNEVEEKYAMILNSPYLQSCENTESKYIEREDGKDEEGGNVLLVRRRKIDSSLDKIQ